MLKAEFTVHSKPVSETHNRPTEGYIRAGDLSTRHV